MCMYISEFKRVVNIKQETSKEFDQLSSYKFCYMRHSVCPRGEMVKAMDCRIVVSEFELQSHYYVHFRVNTPYPPSYG